MGEYGFIVGDGSDVLDYKDELVEKLGDEKVGFFDDNMYGSIKEFSDKFDKLVVLGRIEEFYLEDLKTISDNKKIVSENNIDGILPIKYDELVVDSIYDSIRNIGDRYKANDLLERISTFDNMGVVLHDGPDPDAISSGLAMKYLGELNDTDMDIMYSGSINHQENKALINRLELDMKNVKVKKKEMNGKVMYELYCDGEEFSLEKYDGVAMLDTSFTNSKIMSAHRDLNIDVIIDHHSGWEENNENGCFKDIRTERGAVASILTDYFRILDVEPTEKVATSMAHGILTDTLEFDPNAREFTARDIENLSFLYDFVDRSSLEDIKKSSISFETADVLARAIYNRKKQGTNVFSYLGKVNDTDAIPQATDYLKKLEGITTTITYGIEDDRIRLSARNSDIKINIGKELEKIFENGQNYGDYTCSAGGSSRKGGASIPLEAMGMIGKAIKEGGDLDQFESAIQSTIETMLSKIGSS